MCAVRSVCGVGGGKEAGCAVGGGVCVARDGEGVGVKGGRSDLRARETGRDH